jgi:hypothetical protein
MRYRSLDKLESRKWAWRREDYCLPGIARGYLIG